jgi:hypothetical protein
VHEIWHAVLSRSDARLAAINLTSGPVHLIVQRPADEVEVVAIDAREWRFTEALFAGMPLGEALEGAEVGVGACLAGYLAAGRIAAVMSADKDLFGKSRLRPKRRIGGHVARQGTSMPPR